MKNKTIEIFKPVVLIIQLIIAFVCMYFCMTEDIILYGIIAIFFGWQAGWGFKFSRYIEEDTKKD